MTNVFCKQLKELRKQSGLTQTQIADKLNVHLQTVSKWERGVSEPDISMLGDVAALFDVSVGELLCGIVEPVQRGSFSARELGANLARLRKAAGIDQKTMAAKLCVSADTVSKWEHARICPNNDNLLALAHFFEVSPTALYFGTATPKNVGATATPKKLGKWSIFAIVVAAVLVLAAIVLCAVLVPHANSGDGTLGSGTSNSGASAGNGEQAPHTCQYGEWQVTLRPTCTAVGTKTRTCTICGEKQHDSVAATGHTYNDTVVAPTCVKQGYTLHVCSVCNYRFSDSTTRAAGHTYANTVVAPTCLQGGYTRHTCEVCNNTYTDTPTSAAGHTEKALQAVAATCTQNGLTSGSVCSVCNKVLVQQQVVWATGHALVDGACQNCSFALEPSYDCFQYELLDDGTYKLTENPGTVFPEELVLPWQYNGSPVTVWGRLSVDSQQAVKNVYIPASITTIELEAMTANNKLQAVYYMGTLAQWMDVQIGDYNFKYGHELYLNGVCLENLHIPEGVTVVKKNHFGYVLDLQTIVIADTVAEIEEYAFECCTDVQQVYIPHNVHIVGKFAFLDLHNATISCQAPEKPNGWADDWAYLVPNVVWDDHQ